MEIDLSVVVQIDNINELLPIFVRKVYIALLSQDFPEFRKSDHSITVNIKELEGLYELPLAQIDFPGKQS